MKKIININLSGRVIPIEDSAYEKLQGYIESLRRHFANEEGRDEIINDIESRIAELMNEKVRKGTACVTDADVDEIIGSMGRPEDFEAEEMAAEPGTQSQQNQQTADTGYTGRPGRSRLYRDTSDKFIGGVCSGLANYLNLDPTIVRILFAIVTFGGFGAGILLYIILWIILPTKDLEGFSGKRLYRNPDDRVIGGVAGGLAAYFNRSSSMIRLIFAAPLLLNVLFGVLNGVFFAFHRDVFPNIFIGSFTATFTFAYVVLWIVLPEARSQYEKMEMRGEKVDVNTIRQNVKEGMQQTKERLKDWGTEVKESAQNFGNKAKEFANTKGKAFAAEAGEAARRTGHGLGHAIAVLFKVFFLFVAGSIAFGLFVGLIMLIFGGIAWWPVNNFLWTSNWQQAYAWGTLIFFLGVPLLGFIIWLIRRIIRVRSHSSYLGWTFGGLWTIGWICAILFAASIGKDLREYRYVDSDINIMQPQNGKMIVMVSQPALEVNRSNWWINWDSNGWDMSDDTLKLSTIRFDVQKSEDNNYYVRERRYSAGRTINDAMDRAKKIQYNISYKDSILDLGNGYAIDRDSKFRGQKIEIEISIPAGKKIRFDESLAEKLNPMNIRISGVRNWRRRPVNIDFDDNDFFPWRTGVEYIMGTDGRLKDVNGNTVAEDYRYKQNDSTSLDKSIEQKKKELQELEDKKNNQQKQKVQKPTGYLQEKIKDKEACVAVITNSPVFSLVNIFN
ncbi:MAG: PspC domain-containing protein [Chitinophagales bacterium]